jgi:hypothetical protein
MEHTSACDKCSKTGLPILFTRYAAAFSATTKGKALLDALKPTKGKLKAQPGGIALHTAKYGVRMLRSGYLYLRLESRHNKPEWLGYAVHPHGYHTEFDVESPHSAKAEAACKPNEWGANRSLVWIQDARNITKLWYMFHPDLIDSKHLDSEIVGNLKTYMQGIDVAGWVEGATGQDHTMLPGDLDSQVADFAALSNIKLKEAMELQYYGLMGTDPYERQWGNWEEHNTHTEGIPFDDFGRTQEVTEIVKHPQPDYADVHGTRLHKIAAYLKKHKGAVVACDDAIGIAQSLAMAHPLAVAPYELWSNTAPSDPDIIKAVANFSNMTNGWLAMAAGSIDQLLGAMKAGLLAGQGESLKQLQDMRDKVATSNLIGGYSTTGHRWQHALCHARRRTDADAARAGRKNRSRASRPDRRNQLRPAGHVGQSPRHGRSKTRGHLPEPAQTRTGCAQQTVERPQRRRRGVAASRQAARRPGALQRPPRQQRRQRRALCAAALCGAAQPGQLRYRQGVPRRQEPVHLRPRQLGGPHDGLQRRGDWPCVAGRLRPAASLGGRRQQRLARPWRGAVASDRRARQGGRRLEEGRELGQQDEPVARQAS